MTAQSGACCLVWASDWPPGGPEAARWGLASAHDLLPPPPQSPGPGQCSRGRGGGSSQRWLLSLPLPGAAVEGAWGGGGLWIGDDKARGPFLSALPCATPEPTEVGVAPPPYRCPCRLRDVAAGPHGAVAWHSHTGSQQWDSRPALLAAPWLPAGSCAPASLCRRASQGRCSGPGFLSHQRPRGISECLLPPEASGGGHQPALSGLWP